MCFVYSIDKQIIRFQHKCKVESTRGRGDRLGLKINKKKLEIQLLLILNDHSQSFMYACRVNSPCMRTNFIYKIYSAVAKSHQLPFNGIYEGKVY